MNTENPKQAGPDRQATTRIERNFISKSQQRRIEIQSEPTKTTTPPPPTTSTDPITDLEHAPLTLPAIEKPLLETLPKNPSEIPRDELVDRFEELALRCFNKENTLDMAKALIKSYEIRISEQAKTITDLREEVDDQMVEISDYRDELRVRGEI